jgi:hypothetical protein
MRKVVQIQMAGSVVIALCEDGTIWKLDGGPVEFKWTPLPDIPPSTTH